MSISDPEKDFFRNDSLFFNEGEIEEPEVLFPLATIRNLHEKDTICTVCKCNFGVKGLAHTQKAQCKFCYRGVCVRCLVFYYYHSESKVYEKMCPNCHNRLVAISEEFAEQIRQARLERIQLRKEVELSSKEKEIHIEERKIIENQLASAKNVMIMNSTEKKVILEEANSKNKELNNKISDLHNIFSNLNLNFDILFRRYKNLKNTFDSLKSKNNQELKLINSLKDEISQIKIKKISLMKVKESKFTKTLNNEKVEEIESLKVEILKLKQKIIEKTQELEDLKKILIESENKQAIREDVIDDHKRSLYVSRNSVVDNEISAEEQKELENMRIQIEKYDGNIEILNQKLLNKSVTKSKKSNSLVNPKEQSTHLKNNNFLKEKDRNCFCQDCVIN